MVYLIGAGAGDAGLLTVKAREILEVADVVIYDRLADEKILNFAPFAKKIYVGKSPGQHTFAQSEINKILVSEGAANKIVVRLKGGDPFVFGRGGEEALYLRENNLDFEIISGVTSAVAVPAYAGIPVTHRGVAASFAVVTGHEDPAKPESTIHWNELANGVDTLIFLMGIANLPKITAKLIDAGRAKNTPAAVIQNGTKPSQKVLMTTLENAAADVERENLQPPAIFIVGDVVTLREKLKWFDNKILFGKKFLNTRARSQASTLTKKLESLGAEVIEFPTIKITPPTDNFKALDAAVKNLRGYDWIIFTSSNGVEKFFERLKIFKLDARALSNAKVASIGTATAQTLSNFGIIADVIPKEFRAESLVDALQDDVSDKNILIVRAEVAREVLPRELEKFGAKVTLAAAYKTVADAENVDKIKSQLDSVDFVTFTSSSTVENFVKALGVESLSKVKAAAIGPITAQTLKSYGVDAKIIAKTFTINGLVEVLKKFYLSVVENIR